MSERSPSVAKERRTSPDISFEDLEEAYDGKCTYPCSNEDPTVWHELVKDKAIRRAAGICSGGEVGLWALLPVVKEELVLIDHSYYPLGIAITKYLLIQKLGGKKAAKILSNLKSWGDLDKHLGSKWIEKLPAKSGRTEDYTCDQIARVWRKLKHADHNRLNNAVVRFVHGDFLHLPGQFDLFYLSNAWEESNGNRVTRVELLRAANDKVKVGGYILVAGYGFSGPRNWKLLENKEGKIGNGWRHYLYQKAQHDEEGLL